MAVTPDTQTQLLASAHAIVVSDTIWMGDKFGRPIWTGLWGVSGRGGRWLNFSDACHGPL